MQDVLVVFFVYPIHNHCMRYLCALQRYTILALILPPGWKENDVNAIVICFFLAKFAAVKDKRKDLLVRSPWTIMSVRYG